MPALNTDKFRLASGSSRPVAASLSAPKTAGSTTASLTVATGWNTTTGVDVVIYRKDPTDKTKVLAGSQTDWVAVLSGTTLSTMVLKAGTEPIAGYAADSDTVVFCTPTAAWGDDIVNGILNFADQDGTLKAGAVDNAAVLASDVVTTAKILDANVTTNKVANANITPAKLGLGVVAGTILGTGATLSGLAATSQTALSTAAFPTVSITITAGQIVFFTGSVYAQNNNSVAQDVSIGIRADGTTVPSAPSSGLFVFTSVNVNNGTNIPITGYFAGLSAGAHTFSLWYNVSSSSTSIIPVRSSVTLLALGN